MKYLFVGEPNMLVKSRHKVQFENTIKFKPLFRFDNKGEYITDNEDLIKKLVSRFDHRIIKDEVVEPIKEEKVEEVKEEKVVEITKKFACKKCPKSYDTRSEFMKHIHECKGRKQS